MNLSAFVQKLIRHKEEIYGEVVAKLRSEQLRATGIPDKYLEYITLEFNSRYKRRYQLTFLAEPYEDIPNPSVILFGYKLVDTNDFGRVEQRVSEIVDGDLGKLVKDFEEYSEDKKLGLSRFINLRQKPTQSTVANFVDLFHNHFQDVIIEGVYFINVPKSVYENSLLSRLPKENLRITP